MDVLTDLNALYDAFRASIRGSRWKKDAQAFGMNFLPNLVSLKEDVENHTYKTGEGTEFKHNERGKVRRIHGASVRDRTIRQSWDCLSMRRKRESSNLAAYINSFRRNIR